MYKQGTEVPSLFGRELKCHGSGVLDKSAYIGSFVVLIILIAPQTVNPLKPILTISLFDAQHSQEEDTNHPNRKGPH